MEKKKPEVFKAELYNEIMINEREVSFNLTEIKNEIIKKHPAAFEQDDQDSAKEKFLYIYSVLSLDTETSMCKYSSEALNDPYQFLIFIRYDALEKIQIMEEHLFLTVFQFWMPYLIAASAIYMTICWVIIDKVATNMTKPFLELS